MKKSIKAALAAALSAVIITAVLASGLFGGVSANVPGEQIYDSQAQIDSLEAQINYATVAAETPSDAVGSFGGYIIATDYMAADGKTDVADAIQSMIDSNPNRTIYFPDGIFLISKPIKTPADPRKSVDLQLSNYAVFRAAENFEGEALVQLGGKDAANDTHTPGSNYSLTGGVLDANGKTNGVTIDSGRETVIKDVSIKNAVIGIHIKYGANSGSSDADVSDVNIIGTGGTDSTGILVEGYDNTFTNIRIGNVFTGVHLKTSSNSLRNIHPLYYSDYTDYENSTGFYDEGSNNIYDFCYSDQFCVGFRTADGVSSIFDNCFCYWYTSIGGKEVAFRAEGAFNSVVTNFRAGFRNDTENHVLEAEKIKGSGIFENLLVDSSLLSGKTHIFFLESGIIPFFRRLFS